MRWAPGLEFVAGINLGTYDLSSCASYTAAYTDWRMPNVNELESSLNAEAATPADWLAAEGFAQVEAGRYWSSTTQAGPFPEYKWTVSMDDGVDPVAVVHNTGNLYVWPVRAGQREYADPAYPANVWKTGQKTSQYTGDDGDLEMGVAWPAERFADHGNGTVTDNLTGLVWLKDANCFETKLWQVSLDTVADFNLNPGAHACAEYTAGHEDWRLPNRKELLSLVDRTRYYEHAVPLGHPFVNVASQYWGVWWSSTTDPANHVHAYRVRMSGNGEMEVASKGANPAYIWPVRDPGNRTRFLPWVPILLGD